MRTIPWARLLCEMGTARPFLRCTAAKHGISNEPFYHKEPVMPIKADACSRGTPGRVEHRARNASGHREGMPHCRPDDVRGGFVLCRCVERADLIVEIVKMSVENATFFAAVGLFFPSHCVLLSDNACGGMTRC